MSPKTWLCLAGASAFVLTLAASLSWVTAADSEPEAVDLTLSRGGNEFTNSIDVKLVRIPRGKFWMGAVLNESGAQPNEFPRHQVTITKDFYLGVYEVTQKQYQKVTGKNPSAFSKTGAMANLVANMDTSDFPVENVSWDDAQEFCKKLNALTAEKGAGRTYRLPTEAEWEYACRGGADVREPFTFERPSKSASSKQANFNGTLPFGGGEQGPQLLRTCKVGSFKANPFGLYDMHGNVVEWCQDWFGEATYRDKDRSDPTGPTTGQYRLLKGGTYNYDAQFCRSAYRNYTSPNSRDASFGFRVACSLRQD